MQGCGGRLARRVFGCTNVAVTMPTQMNTIMQSLQSMLLGSMGAMRDLTLVLLIYNAREILDTAEIVINIEKARPFYG